MGRHLLGGDQQLILSPLLSCRGNSISRGDLELFVLDSLELDPHMFICSLTGLATQMPQEAWNPACCYRLMPSGLAIWLGPKNHPLTLNPHGTVLS